MRQMRSTDRSTSDLEPVDGSVFADTGRTTRPGQLSETSLTKSKRTGRRPMSDSELSAARERDLSALRACADSLNTEELSPTLYDDWRKSLFPGSDKLPPTSHAIRRHFSGFAEGVQAAGLRARQRKHPRGDQLSYVGEPVELSEAEETVVRYALSQYIGKTFRTDRRGVYDLCRILGSLSGLGGPGRSGGWPSGPSVFAWLDLTHEQLNEMWDDAEREDGLLPHLILASFVPPRLWAAVYELIAAGPRKAWDSVDQLLRAWARGRDVDGAKRDAGGSTTLPGGELAQATVAHFISSFYAFMYALDRVRALSAQETLSVTAGASEALVRWRREDLPPRPTAADLNSVPANTVRDAPSLRLIRLVIAIASHEAEESTRQASRSNTLVRHLRDRAMIATLVITGLRRAAFNRLTLRDVEERFRFPDGEIGPAIVPRPGKSLSVELKRPKGIPTFLHAWIREYAEAAGIDQELDSPLWVSLESAARVARRPLTDEQIRNIVRARFDRDRVAARDPRSLHPLYRAFLDEHDGRDYSPHQLRHAAEQLGFVVGLDWLEENRTTLLQQGSGLPSNPQVFPDALLDHSMGGLGDRYKDVSSERGRLKWARKCAIGIGDYIVGEVGARRGPDPELIAERRRMLDHANTRREEVMRELDSLEERVLNAGTTLDVKEIGLANVQMARLARRLASLASEAECARAALAEADALLVPIPDHLTTRDLEQLMARGRDHTIVALAEEDHEAIEVIRDWATLDEFHWALGGSSAVSIETLRRWARGGKTKLGRALGLSDSEDASGDRPACIERISDRKQRVLLSALNWARLPIRVQENLEVIRRTPEESPRPSSS